jgi:hypothetical protein
MTHRQLIDGVAAAVLYEGYILFPYRKSAMKNRQRWTFGGVYPRAYSESAGGEDPWRMQTQCLVLGDQETELAVSIRFLHVIDRKVAEAIGANLRFVEELRVDDRVYTQWDEAKEREVAMSPGEHRDAVRIGKLLTGPVASPIEFAAGSEIERLTSESGQNAGALFREWGSIRAIAEISCDRVRAPGPFEGCRREWPSCFRVTVSIVNDPSRTARADAVSSREAALRHTLVSTHTILSVYDGDFVSQLEPPEPLREAAEACLNIKTWPVLIGSPGERCTMLSSPIILYDYPAVSPESGGDNFDGTEISELRSLGVLALTDDEKREMRESDPRRREILDRAEALTPQQILDIHGVIRSIRPSEPFEDQGDTPGWGRTAPQSVLIDGVNVSRGSRVRVRPRPGADIMDMALADRVAVVESIEQDFEDRVYVAVTIEDDPGRDLGDLRMPAHRFFFSVNELTPLDGGS